MQTKTIIANDRHADKIENLRRIAYHNSTGFTVINEDEFEKYCRWNNKDKTGIVLAIVNEMDEILSCLRANVYFTSLEHEENNPSFANCTKGFIQYPALDMTFAATLPDYFKSGFLSILRFYMYRLHRHTVKSITGQVVKESTLYFTLQKLGYTFKEIDKTRKDLEAANNWTLANLDYKNFDSATDILRLKYKDSIAEYPLMISE
ncbi:MAG: hypothetical protein U0V75_02775 [Ferruginibacter sp.]